MRGPSRHSGFTLIEVVVAMAVVVVITVIGVPSFRAHVLKSNRAAVKTALLNLASLQEGFRADRRSYAGSFTELGLQADTLYVSKAGDLLASESPNVAYRIELAADQDAFELEAVPVNGQVSDETCGTLKLQSDGKRTASGPSGTGCWQK